MPLPGLLHPEPLPLWQATADLYLCRRHSNTQRHVWLSLCGVSCCAQVLFEPSKHLWWVWGLILNVILLLLPSCWGFSFAIRCGVSFFGGIQQSPFNDCSAVSRNFGVLTGEVERTSFYSTTLFDNQKRCPFHYESEVKVKSLSRVRLFATPWTVAYQAPPSMGFSRQEYWSGLPIPSPGDLPNLRVKPGSLVLQADSLPFEPPGEPIF